MNDFLANVIVAIIIFAISGLVMMFLWNSAIIEVFEAKEISYWTAVGLSIFVSFFGDLVGLKRSCKKKD